MFAALLQSLPSSSEQPRQESKPLLGTEASSGAPSASGVKSATLRYDLPTPVVAVRNLVRPSPQQHVSHASPAAAAAQLHNTCGTFAHVSFHAFFCKLQMPYSLVMCRTRNYP